MTDEEQPSQAAPNIDMAPLLAYVEGLKRRADERAAAEALWQEPLHETARASWRDWTPDGYPEPADDELITREQLVEELNRANVKMTARNLRHWEALGILPGPIRRRHDGATRALYAPWVVRLGMIAAAAKTFGSSPEKLGREMRGVAATVIVQAELRKQVATDERIRDAAKALADRYEEYLGERPALVGMTFRRDDGVPLYDFEIPAPE